MTEHGDERKVLQRYRELPREEPPAHLDAAIRAEARRLGAAHPAPLVPPTGRRSWHYPLAAAAVLVLAVAVTLHVEREQPDPAAVVPAPASPAAPPRQAQAEPEAKAVPEVRGTGRKADAPPPLRSETTARQRKDEPGFAADSATQDKAEAKPSEAPAAPASTPRTPESAPSAAEEASRALAKERSAEMARDTAPMMSQRSAPVPAAKSAAGAAAVEAPEAWLERIARLRRQGKHEEADKALAEFRKRYPDFKIPPDMLEQVEKK